MKNNFFLQKKQPYFIAEIGVNHNGSISLAKKMVREAKKAGANAAKFQSFLAKALVSPSTPKVAYQKKHTSKMETHYEMIKKLEFSKKAHFILRKYCARLGLDFISTPYDVGSAKFLHSLGVKFFKTASADLVDYPLHEYIASTKIPVAIAVGMATLGEIESTLDIYKKYNHNQIILLHCVSNYPAKDQSMNLNVLTTLQQAFQLPVGFSDHSVGPLAAVVASCCGARLYEKHFTLSKKMKGPDHASSATPKEFKQVVDAVTRCELLKGSPIKKCQEEESQMKIIARKSIHLAQAIKANDRIKRKHLVMKRPGDGISPMVFNGLIGKRARINLKEGTKIREGDLV